MLELNLNELTLENIGQWPKTFKIGLITLLSALILGIGYWFFIQGNFEKYDSLQQEEIQLKQKFEMMQHQASNLNAYRIQLETMEKRFGKMLKQLPSKNEMPGLLEDISKTGVTSGLNFELFAPMPEVLYDFYVELPIKITVVGRYEQLAMFFSRVAQMSRIVTIHDFVIKSVVQDAKKKRTEDELTMSMTVKIYRYRTQ